MGTPKEGLSASRSWEVRREAGVRVKEGCLQGGIRGGFGQVGSEGRRRNPGEENPRSRSTGMINWGTMGNKTSAQHHAKPKGDARLQPACIPPQCLTGLILERATSIC